MAERNRNVLVDLHVPMATVRFTQNIQRHVACPTREVEGGTLRAVLDEYFRDNERARGYVLDERGKIRQHMVVFIDGELVRDRDGLSDRVDPNSVIDVIQALSGGAISL
jgi:molybdopterin synthase sulfur carrier subunit